MSQRLRIAIATVAVAAIVGGASYQSWLRRPSVVHEFDWGNVRGNGVLNGIASIGVLDDERGRFSYHTGGRAGDAGTLTPAPTHVLAEAVHGSVSVRLLGFEDHERASAHDEALEVARIASAATTTIYPVAAIPVEIDLHFMPETARFSLAKRVDWRADRPYALAIFEREPRFDATTPTHELYHVLALGSSQLKSATAIRKIGATASYEQVAADLYAACGELLANETLARDAPSTPRSTIVDPALGERVFEGVLAGDELAAALDLLAKDSAEAGMFGDLLSVTVFDQLFGEATAIPLGSPQATKLLALCSETAADPSALRGWLAGLVPAAGTSASARD